eukprot:1727653-Pyramimonas_sp.AAC.1
MIVHPWTPHRCLGGQVACPHANGAGLGAAAEPALPRGRPSPPPLLSHPSSSLPHFSSYLPPS